MLGAQCWLSAHSLACLPPFCYLLHLLNSGINLSLTLTNKGWAFLMGRVYEAREIFTSSEYGKGWLGGVQGGGGIVLALPLFSRLLSFSDFRINRRLGSRVNCVPLLLLRLGGAGRWMWMAGRQPSAGNISGRGSTSSMVISSLPW